MKITSELSTEQSSRLERVRPLYRPKLAERQEEWYRRGKFHLCLFRIGTKVFIFSSSRSDTITVNDQL